MKVVFRALHTSVPPVEAILIRTVMVCQLRTAKRIDSQIMLPKGVSDSEQEVGSDLTIDI